MKESEQSLTDRIHGLENRLRELLEYQRKYGYTPLTSHNMNVLRKLLAEAKLERATQQLTHKEVEAYLQEGFNRAIKL